MILERTIIRNEKNQCLEVSKKNIVIIPFDDSCAEFPIINIKIFNKDLLMLIDTGANTSILSKSFFDKYSPSYLTSDITYEIEGINGSTIENPAYNLCFYAKDVKMESLFTVGDFNLSFDSLKFDCLIGCDVIRKYDMHIDLVQKIVWFTTENTINES
jgi:hypothetical protein